MTAIWNGIILSLKPTQKIIVSYGTISTFFFNITTITYVNIIMLSSVYWHMYLQQKDNVTETVYAYN